MTKNELIDKIDKGYDIMFSVLEKHYTIITWMDEGIAIGEQYPNDGMLQFYDTAEELVDGFMVGGKSLGELSDRINITDYT